MYLKQFEAMQEEDIILGVNCNIHNAKVEIT